MKQAKDTQEFRHPSFGMIGFNRYTTRSQRLFGSAVKSDTGISLTVSRAFRRHHLHYDSYFNDSHPLIEVHMTESQFASLITSFGMGGGVPCTLGSFDGKIIKPSETERSEAELIHEEITDRIEDFHGRLQGAKDRLSASLAGAKLSQKDRKTIDFAIEVLLADLANNLPFLMEQFQDAVEKTVAQAKTEIVSFTEQAARKAGLPSASVPAIDFDPASAKAVKT